jgi:hypothetical protein
MFPFARARVLAPMFAVLFLTAASPAFGQTHDEGIGAALHFSGGWAQLQTTNEGFLENEDGWYLDAELSWRLHAGSPLHFGVSINGSYFTADENRVVPELTPLESHVSVDPGVFAVEPRLRLVLTTNRDGSGLYFAPRIGAGLLIFNYDTIVETRGLDHNLWRGEHDTNYGFMVRPALEVGISNGTLTLGAEASYMWGWVDMGSLGDELEEMRAGVFFRAAF